MRRQVYDFIFPGQSGLHSPHLGPTTYVLVDSVAELPAQRMGNSRSEPGKNWAERPAQTPRTMRGDIRAAGQVLRKQATKVKVFNGSTPPVQPLVLTTCCACTHM